MRTGFATSACAAAAAAAAVSTLAQKKTIGDICIDLPALKGVKFPLVRCEIYGDEVCCGVIKDAGDDPDVTHALEIQAIARWSEAPGIILRGGMGVGESDIAGLAGGRRGSRDQPGPAQNHPSGGQN